MLSSPTSFLLENHSSCVFCTSVSSYPLKVHQTFTHSPKDEFGYFHRHASASAPVHIPCRPALGRGSVTKAESQSRSRWLLCTFLKVWTTVALTSGDEIYHHLTASSTLGITHTSILLTHKTKGVDKNDPKFQKSDKFTFIFKIKFIISEFSLLRTVLTSQINHEIYSNKCSYMENTHTHTELTFEQHGGFSIPTLCSLRSVCNPQPAPYIHSSPLSVALHPRIQTAMGPVLVLTTEKTHAYMNLPSSDHVVQGQPCVYVRAHSISLLL